MDAGKKPTPALKGLRTYAEDLQHEREERTSDVATPASNAVGNNTATPPQPATSNTLTQTISTPLPAAATTTAVKAAGPAHTITPPVPVKNPDRPTPPPVTLPDRPALPAAAEVKAPTPKILEPGPTLPPKPNLNPAPAALKSGSDLRDSSYEATIITDAKHKRFRLGPAIVTSLQDWWIKQKKARAKRKIPKYTVPEAEHRKGVIQQATSMTGRVAAADHNAVLAKIRENAASGKTSLASEIKIAAPAALVTPVPVPPPVPSLPTPVPTPPPTATEINDIQLGYGSDTEPLDEEGTGYTLTPPPIVRPIDREEFAESLTPATPKTAIPTVPIPSAPKVKEPAHPWPEPIPIRQQPPVTVVTPVPSQRPPVVPQVPAVSTNQRSAGVEMNIPPVVPTTTVPRSAETRKPIPEPRDPIIPSVPIAKNGTPFSKVTPSLPKTVTASPAPSAPPSTEPTMTTPPTPPAYLKRKTARQEFRFTLPKLSLPQLSISRLEPNQAVFGMLIVLTVVFLGYAGINALFFNAGNTTVITPVSSNFFKNSGVAEIELSSLDRRTVLTNIKNETTGGESLTEFRLVDLSRSTITTGVFTTMYYDSLTPDFLASVETVRFGQYRNSPWIIIQVLGEEAAKGGMLAWERTMSADLDPLFGSTIRQITGDTATGRFTDEVHNDKDVRVLKDSENNERIVYGFLDQNTILITTSTFAFLNLLAAR